MACVDVFKVLKERSCQPRILYLAKLSFKNEGEIKTFPDKKDKNIWCKYLLPIRDSLQIQRQKKVEYR